MKVLILGASGLMGHKFFQMWSERHDCWGTIRQSIEDWRGPTWLPTEKLVDQVCVANRESIERAIMTARPEIVVNGVGLVKQALGRYAAQDFIEVNSVFPHRLNDLCTRHGARLLHISTDCVFSGARGGYSEDDAPDARDLYGLSKLLGEPEAGCLTLRTSVVGREIREPQGLLEWLLGSEGKSVKGYERAVFSGLSSIALGRAIEELFEVQSLEGVFHLSAEPICKLDLITMLRDRMSLDIDIRPVPQPVVDRSLNGDRLLRATGIRVPSWDEMIEDLASDPTSYTCSGSDKSDF